ncbi:MAG: hypothetical protein IH861_10440 [Chloroflexi bacterium]|nr:hypothetical protein [Chloroflexota bacterium]
MAIYSIRDAELVELQRTTFQNEGIRERDDLQRILRERIEVISPGTMVIAEEFGDWENSYRRIDLLCLDQDANLVVIELKRTETGGHMELQAIRYAAMVSTMTFHQVVDAHERYLNGLGRSGADAKGLILQFLGWNESQPEELPSDVRIVLVSAEFSKEVTSSVLWLNDRGLDIRCVRLRPYKLDSQLLLDVQQVLPLPEAQEHQIRIREKSEQQRVARQTHRDYTRYDLTIGDKVRPKLYKRAFIFEVVREAVKRGASPDAIEQAAGLKNLWISVDGELTQQGFIEAATELIAFANVDEVGVVLGFTLAELQELFQ